MFSPSVTRGFITELKLNYKVLKGGSVMSALEKHLKVTQITEAAHTFNQFVNPLIPSTHQDTTDDATSPALRLGAERRRVLKATGTDKHAVSMHIKMMFSVSVCVGRWLCKSEAGVRCGHWSGHTTKHEVTYRDAYSM